MNSTDNTQSKNKKNSNEVIDESEYGSRVKNVKGYTLYTFRAGKGQPDDRIEEYKYHLHKDVQLQNNTKMKEELPEQMVRDSKD